MHVHLCLIRSPAQYALMDLRPRVVGNAVAAGSSALYVYVLSTVVTGLALMSLSALASMLCLCARCRGLGIVAIGRINSRRSMWNSGLALAFRCVRMARA